MAVTERGPKLQGVTPLPYRPSEFRDVLHSLSIVCFHCKLRTHPQASSGCNAGEFSVRDDDRPRLSRFGLDIEADEMRWRLS